MASKSKKVVTKDDLRRLMKEKKSVVKINKKKIEHPLAKYNSLDQLVCTLCNCVIKSDILWQPHIQSRQHKDKAKVGPQSIPSIPLKRKATDEDDYSSPNKITKGIGKKDVSEGLPSDFFDKGSSNGKKPLKSILTNSNKAPLLSQYSSSDSEEEESKEAPSTTTLAKSELPSDFFDVGVMPSASASKEAPTPEPKASQMSDVLPEGFFDDPKQDAKVRKVEYVDKMEEEWEMFQRAMKEETHVSEAIIEEEDEQVNVDRNIDEIDEQIQCWKEVNDLQTKKEEIMKQGPKDSKNSGDSDDELNEEDLEEFLDWRSKKSLR